MPYFVVVVERADAWDWSRPMREQAQWDEHATFMDELGDARFIVSGGPLGSEDAARRILHIVSAPDAAAVRDRVGADPWHHMGLLKIVSIEPWTVLVGSKPSA